jgi:hypothetical protein
MRFQTGLLSKTSPFLKTETELFFAAGTADGPTGSKSTA